MAQSSSPDPLIGATLEGRFKVERLLGEGGMGRVYVADELRLGRRCALKVLLPELTSDPDCVERFLREARAIAQIHHENVVDIYHLGDHSAGTVFFAMELLTGEDLERRIDDRKRPKMEWPQVCYLLVQIAAAMIAVHAAGLIHRDLKPSNIFIHRRRDGREQVKLLDFGIVKLSEGHAGLTGTGAALGTPYYMSPEQILNEPLDRRTDIYSFGVLCFEALAGRLPFVGEPIQVAMQHCNVAPPQLAVLAPELPGALCDLVMRMLEKDPGARIQTMEVVEQLLMDIMPPEAWSAASLQDRPITGPGARATPSSAQIAAAAAEASSRAAAPTVGITVPRPAARPWLVPALAGVSVLGVIAALLGLLSGDDPGVVVAAAAEPETKAAPKMEPEPEPKPEPPPDAKVEPETKAEPDTKATEVKAPEAKPPGERKDRPPRSGEAKPVDPHRAIRKAAAACRKKHRAVGGATMTVSYVLGSDGGVTTAKSDGSELGRCFEAAIKPVRFPAPGKIKFEKIDL